MSVDLLSLSRGSGEARTDSPDGFVSEDDLTEVFSREREYGFFELLLYDFEVLASFALFLDFADAEDRSKAFSESQTYLIREDSTIFVVVSTALRVAEDDVACTRRSDLCSRDFTRVSTFSLVSAVLSSDSYGATFSFLSDRCEVDEGAPMMTSQWRDLPARAALSSPMKEIPSLRVLFIFQLPATIFFLIVTLIKRIIWLNVNAS